MSKRPNDSRAPPSDSEDLVERLKVVANDAVLPRETVENSESVCVTAAFATLLAGDNWNESNKALNRPCPRTANETFVDILLFVDRDELDALQLVCCFLLKFIEDRGVEQLPLRSISRVDLVEFYSSCPAPFQVVRDSHTSLCPLGVSQLAGYLRFANCESVCIDLRCTICPKSGGQHEAGFSEIFGETVLPKTFVHILTVRLDDACVFHAQRAFKAFKRVSKMIVTVKHYEDWPCFNETFFISAAEIGVRSVIFDPDGEYASSGSTSGRGYFTGIDVLGALAFGFAEPTTGGKRSLSKMLVSDADKRIGRDFYENVNFLAPLVKARKARELDGRQRINFKFTIDKLAKPICPVGFEKYQEDICSWLIDDLENGIVLKVVEAYRVVEIHVFYSV